MGPYTRFSTLACKGCYDSQTFEKISCLFQIVSLPEERNMVNLVFYGDKTNAKMFKTTLVSFDDGFKQFKPGNRSLLNKAVKEVLLERFGR